MVLVKGISELSHSIHHPVVTIGNFDGVHQGHQRIIRLAIEKAKGRQGQCVAYTFRPHPQVALRPATSVQLLSTYDERAEYLQALGVDVVIEEPFSREFSTTEPAQFFTDILLRVLNAEAIVVGYDFAFGKERHGHLDVLAEFCKNAGVELTIVQPQRVEGEVVSSSRIRQHLLAAEIEIANHLLGRPFSYKGIVIKGEGRGRKIGFPTANLKVENKLVLPYGVYATWATIDGVIYPSVTNVGMRPTFQKEGNLSPVLVETHLLNTRQDFYGNQLEVQFIKRLRDEQKFPSIDALKKQIEIDIQSALQVLTRVDKIHS